MEDFKLLELAQDCQGSRSLRPWRKNHVWEWGWGEWVPQYVTKEDVLLVTVATKRRAAVSLIAPVSRLQAKDESSSAQRLSACAKSKVSITRMATAAGALPATSHMAARH